MAEGACGISQELLNGAGNYKPAPFSVLFGNKTVPFNSGDGLSTENRTELFSRMESFDLNGRNISKRTVDTDIIKPEHIIFKFQFKFIKRIKRIKRIINDKLSFKDFVSCP